MADSIFKRIIEAKKAKRRLAGTIGAGLAALLLLSPSYHIIRSKINSRDNDIFRDIATGLVDKCHTEKDVTTILKPYLKQHMDVVGDLPETYEVLTTLQKILPRKVVESKPNNLETKINVDGESRVDIGTNSYFTQFPVSKSLSFISGLGAVYDEQSGSLYSINNQNQQLENPIRDVSSIAELNGEIYMVQGSSLFKFNNGHFVKEREGLSKNAFKIVDNTPFAVVLTKYKREVIGHPNNEKDAQNKVELEERLKRVNDFEPDPTTKVRFENNRLYVGSQNVVKIIEKGKAVVDIVPDGKLSRIIDYIILNGSGDESQNVTYPVAIFQTKSDDGGKKFEYSIKVHGLGDDYTISSSTLNANSRFDESDKNWLNTAKLKHDVKSYLRSEISLVGVK